MIGEIVLLLVAGAAATVSVVSAQRGIEEVTAKRASAAALNRRRAGERLDAVYRSLEAQLGSVPGAVAAAGSGPVAVDADVAVAFLRLHLGSASDDEVQRLLPMLQLLQQRALERAAALHPPVRR